MNFDIKKAIAGAVSGLFAAILVDLQAWSESSGKFDWPLALRRWLVGLVSGLIASFGFNTVGNL